MKVNAPVHLRLRVPGWSAGGSIKGAGADRELTKEDAGTYLIFWWKILRIWMCS